ncbi:DUF1801 domain-containing protein [bacterium]|nr:DUF1801 domain-containing protein [bacterium]
MRSNATTVEAYLAELLPERRSALETVRGVILANMDPALEEGIQYAMIGYYVPHRVYPAGYHCDPRQPLPFAGLASRKNYMTLSLFCLYAHGDDGNELVRWFRDAWEGTGRNLDMGKACVRFKRISDVPLDVVAEAFRRVRASEFIAMYEASRRERSR